MCSLMSIARIGSSYFVRWNDIVSGINLIKHLQHLFTSRTLAQTLQNYRLKNKGLFCMILDQL